MYKDPIVFKSNGVYGTIHRHNNHTLDLGGGNDYSILRSDEIEVTCDLPILYKMHGNGEWQELRFMLVLGRSPGIRRVITCKGVKDRVWDSPIVGAVTKAYSSVLETRLQSAWNKKRNRDGWTEHKGAAVLSEPMLLHHYDLFKDRITLPALQFPKLNGIRCIYEVGYGMLSRKRNLFDLPHLKGQLRKLERTVDGELWHPDWDLETIVSRVKGGHKYDDTKELEFHIFDRPHGGSYLQRMAVLIKDLKDVSGDTPNIKVVPMKLVNTYEEIGINHEIIKKMKGVDGSVVRNLNCPYEWNGRSYNVLKIKDIISREFVVDAVLCDEDAKHGRMIKFSFASGAGSFLVVPNWSKERRSIKYAEYQVGDEVFIGDRFTVDFREWTAKGLPRHVVSTTARDYE